jgi:hypothetical protein
MQSRNVRVATVRATGRRYIVLLLSFAKRPGDVDTALCYGQVTAFRGVQTEHAPRLSIPLADVEISEVPKTHQLCQELFDETVAAKRAAGETVSITRSRR